MPAALRLRISTMELQHAPSLQTVEPRTCRIRRRSPRCRHDRIGLVVRSGSATATCPDCRTSSRRIQSRYQRRAADLPLGGRRVELQVMVRRFWCDAAACGRKIFAERFSNDVLPAFARRTSGWSRSSSSLGLALGGRPGAGLAQRLMLPVSRDTLLRVIRRRAATHSDPLSVIGIDDFAWRRNHRYGNPRLRSRTPPHRSAPARPRAGYRTDLAEDERLDPDRRPRPRGGYGEAIARALPQAIQVADRWHLMENASRGFLDAVRRSMRQVREVVGAATIDPALLTAAERIQYEGYLRRKEADAAIRALAEAGVPIRRICQRLGHSRRWCVRSCVGSVPTSSASARVRSMPICPGSMPSGMLAAATRPSFGAGRRDKASEDRCAWSGNGQRASTRGAAQIERLQRVPSARTLARWLTTGRDRLTKAETLTVAAVEDGVPALVEAREVVGAFQTMVRAMAPDRLEGCSRVLAQASSPRSPAESVRTELRFGQRSRCDGRTARQRAGHQTQAGKAPDVWPRQDRPVASSPDRIDLRMISESASEPRLEADPGSRSNAV